MKRLLLIKKVAVLLLPLVLFSATSACEPDHPKSVHDWPIEPCGGIEHPIGNSFGEYQFFDGIHYMHTGIDILGTPRLRYDEQCSCDTEDPTAPWVRITVSGKVAEIDIDETDRNYRYDGLTIIGDDGVTYRYWHLEHDSFYSAFTSSHSPGDPVKAGDKIAQLVQWDCDFHHLHYELEKNGNYLKPLADIAPHQDKTSPEIDGFFFAKDNSNNRYESTWIEFPEDSQRACTVVSCKVDIIVKYRDRDDAGSTLVGASTLGVYNLFWRACPDPNPDCAWQNTRVFDNMPVTWGMGGSNIAEKATTSFYSTNPPGESDSNYCKPTSLYAIVTNFKDGDLYPDGSWDTRTVADGIYTVGVKAVDFAGNETTYFKKACVQNPQGVLCPPSN